MDRNKARNQAQSLLGTGSDSAGVDNRSQNAMKRANSGDTELNTSVYRKQMDFARSVHSSPSDINHPRKQDRRHQVRRKTGI